MCAQRNTLLDLNEYMKEHISFESSSVACQSSSVQIGRSKSPSCCSQLVACLLANHVEFPNYVETDIAELDGALNKFEDLMSRPP